MISILFVCVANICRSPALEAAFRHLAKEKGIGDRFRVDSCGTGWFHLGERADQRTFEAAKERGIVIDHRSQQFQDRFFDEYDLILGVNDDLVRQLKERAANEEQKKKILLATHYSIKYKNQPIPDPYYMSDQGFGQIMEIVIDSCQGLLAYLLDSQARKFSS